MREKIIEDIVNHRIEEVEVGGGGYCDPDELEEFESSLREKSTSELESFWFSNVGEWIEPMRRWDNGEYYTEDGVPLWEENGFDSIAEWQFSKLVDPQKSVDYGFINPKY